MEHFFPRIQVQTCAQMHTRVKLLEGMQVKTILKLLGGYSQIIGGDIYPPSPPDFGTPAWQKAPTLQNKRSRVSCFENQVFVCNVMSDVNVA